MHEPLFFAAKLQNMSLPAPSSMMFDLLWSSKYIRIDAKEMKWADQVVGQVCKLTCHFL
jgi:hypothetical protein